MKLVLGGMALLVGAAVGFGLAHKPAGDAKSRAIHGVGAVGTNPGGVGPGKVLKALIPRPGNELAAFSAGCFWGVEESYRKIPGIVATAVGYVGGSVSFPNYAQAHGSGAAETVLVEFDPRKTSYERLLSTFWKIHTPPSANEADEAAEKRSPYRSAIWTFGSDEVSIANQSLASMERKGHRQILTRIQPILPFFLAEQEHQQNAERNGIEACKAPEVEDHS